MSRGIWFVAGSAVGAYGAARLRRVAEAFTYDGVHDRLSGMLVGSRIFVAEVKAGAAAKETELRRRLDLGPDGDPAQPLSLVRGEDD